MKIENCIAKDIDDILNLYEMAMSYQKIKGATIWGKIHANVVAHEIEEKRQWKMVIENKIVCVWTTTFSDAQIWQERNQDPAVYIHRIATHSDYRGQHLVQHIVNWAKQHALHHNKKWIRLDTVGNNQGLITYYQKCGFDFLGLVQLSETSDLPAHYHQALVSLFEMNI